MNSVNWPVMIAAVVLVPFVLIGLHLGFGRILEGRVPLWIRRAINGFWHGYFISMGLCLLLGPVLRFERFGPSGDLGAFILLFTGLFGAALGIFLFLVNKRHLARKNTSTR